MAERDNPLNTASSPAPDLSRAAAPSVGATLKDVLSTFIGKKVQVFFSNGSWTTKPQAVIEEGGQHWFKASDGLLNVTNANAITVLPEPEKAPEPEHEDPFARFREWKAKPNAAATTQPSPNESAS